MEDVVIQKTVITSEEGNKTVKKIKQRKRRSIIRFAYDWLVKSLLVAGLWALDFILFAGAANNNLFTHHNITLQALYILAGIFSFAFIIQLLFSFSSLLQNFFTALIVFAFSAMIINQFALFDKYSFFYNFISQCLGYDLSALTTETSYIIFAALLGLVFFIYLHMSSKASLAYLTASIYVIIAGLCITKFFAPHPQPEFKVIYADQVKERHTNPKKYVHILLPDLASTSYLTEINQDLNNPKLSKAINIKLGFYAKNEFTYYPHTYVWHQDPFKNLTATLNLSEDGDISKDIRNNFKACCLWEFDQINDKYLYLKHNKLFDVFAKSNYQINAYQSHGIDMCYQNGDPLATKCVQKQNTPAKLSTTNLSPDSKTKILAAEWFESMGLWINMDWLYEAWRLIGDPNQIPVIGMPYNKLYVIDSFDTLDFAAQDIIKDYKNGAYFISLDLPSNMLVYDENCTLKPTDKWVTLQNFPWVKDINQLKRIESYAEQNICLYSKLEGFINKINAAGLEKDTVYVIEGLSPAHGLRGTHFSNFVANFKNTNLTEMAIKDPKLKGFEIDYSICNPSGILSKYLFKQDKCTELTGLGLQDGALGEIKSNLKITYTDDNLHQVFNYFVDWYSNLPSVSEPIPNFVKDPIPLEAAQAPAPASTPEVPEPINTSSEPQVAPETIEVSAPPATTEVVIEQEQAVDETTEPKEPSTPTPAAQ